MKNTLLIFLLFFVSFGSYAQNFGWANSIGGSLWDRSSAITIDKSNNVLTTGSIRSMGIDFDPGPDTNIINDRGIYVNKLDGNGNFKWAKLIPQGGPISNNSTSLTIKTDSKDQVYISGYCSGTTDFDPGPNSYVPSNFGSTDAFVEKFDSSGNMLWARRFGGLWADRAIDFAIDEQHNVYVVGTFTDSMDIDPGPGVFMITANGPENGYILKLDSLGIFQWAKPIVSNGSIGVSHIFNTPSQKLIVTGNFSSTVDFDFSSNIQNRTANGGSEIFVLQIDGGSNFDWVQTYGGLGGDFAHDGKVDQDGNFFNIGYFNTLQADLDPGLGVTLSDTNFDYHLSKFDSLGNFIWGEGVLTDDFTMDSLGNFYLAGQFDQLQDFDPGPGIFNLNGGSQTGSDLFIQKLDSSRNFVFAQSGVSTNYFTRISDLVLDNNLNICYTGNFYDTIDVDMSPNSTLQFVSNGYNQQNLSMYRGINLWLFNNHFLW